MSSWLVVAFVGVFTVALKAAGPVLLGDRELPAVLRGPLALIAPVMLAALVATNTFSDGTHLVIDARLAGVAAGLAAVLLRAPLPLVVVIAAAVAAGTRALGAS
jgi:branched-subunit amino acid transport protein